MKIKKILYGAYGNNMNIDEMKVRCKNATVYGQGYIKNYELNFNEYATIVASKDKLVPVVLWLISDEDKKRLDVYEGVKQGIYRKEILPVKVTKIVENNRLIDISNGEVEVIALIYIMTEKYVLKFANKVPNEEYFKSILEGYRKNGIETSSLGIALLEMKLE
ncbi:gamma-glutamylcyclotransferase family protein [Lysinibacillus telephonicus]|uniref:gamma-glutamylcyclotransferase family protein n=1 Tax=Lysinibacillus telephonicus TaxID=1714840 RepID=UPI0031FCAEAB